MASAIGRSLRPAVEPDEASAPFFDGAARGVLMMQRCNSCGAWLVPVCTFCTECLSEDLAWAQASGAGTVHSYAVVHYQYHPGFKDELPYNIAEVELAEGPRLRTNITGCANEEITVGMKLQVVFERVSDAVSVPVFMPA